MSFADLLTDERPNFRTIAASRRDGWRPAFDRRNWPDDPEMIPERVRLMTTPEMLGQLKLPGCTVVGWLRSGAVKRRTGTGHNWVRRPRPIRPTPAPRRADLKGQAA